MENRSRKGIYGEENKGSDEELEKLNPLEVVISPII
jgi:hypothetical protein